MPRTVYLEAAARTQDLLTTKWILRSCGYVIASTWHEESIPASSGPRSHWGQRLEEMKLCDALIVVRGQEKQIPAELAFTLGFAAARNLRVIWVGAPIELPVCFSAIRFFATPDEFRKQLLLESDPRQTCSSNDLLAA